MNDRQYMTVKAMVLGSWRVQSSMLSRSAKSLEERLEKDKSKEEYDGCLMAEGEVVENKGKAMREEYGPEEGSREGRGSEGEMKEEGTFRAPWRV